MPPAHQRPTHAEARFESAQQASRAERESSLDALREKTEKLRALRLAKEAAAD